LKTFLFDFSIRQKGLSLYLKTQLDFPTFFGCRDGTTRNWEALLQRMETRIQEALFRRQALIYLEIFTIKFKTKEQ